MGGGVKRKSNSMGGGGGGGGGGNKSAFKDPSIFFSGIALIRTQHMFLLNVDNDPCIIAMCSVHLVLVEPNKFACKFVERSTVGQLVKCMPTT